ncbi:hypothetical protein [Nocardioides sp. TF02-7]|uniref:hypothetical protein n=1 Tax=Nocardioides sp. TF02-7 TaxID=2917724 RepID=UPI001F057EEA|nr:hypothetical protein [Nocardioides sp. TF02-7]UMG93552.1 hypothetical protein MF408_04985 [Nocardioides sp. TF02-7]
MSETEPRPSPYPSPATYRRYDPQRERWRLRRRVATFAAGVAVAVGGVGAVGWLGVSALLGADDVSAPAEAAEAVEAPAGATTPDLFTTDGTAALVAALREEAGSSTVTGAVVHRGYAFVMMPPRGDGPRGYYWDGRRLTASDAALTRGRSFELAAVDGAALAGLCTADGTSEPSADCWAEVLVVPGTTEVGFRAWGPHLPGTGRWADLTGRPLG